jgi:pimeloyl-ACP methyl ester carboxylesterase
MTDAPKSEIKGKMQSTRQKPIEEVIQDRVEVSGTVGSTLATETTGSGVPFVWSHALLGSMAQDRDGGVLAWNGLTDIAKVVRFDARGHGKSGVEGTSQDYSWEQQAQNMWQVIEHHGLQEVVLGGASMGAATSLHAAVQQPERVKGLVLVIPPTAWSSRTKMKRNYGFMASFVNGTFALPVRLLKFLPKADKQAGFQNVMMSVVAQHAAKMSRLGIVGAFRGAALSDLPSVEDLSKLTKPVLILAWTGDKTHPMEVAETLRDTLPNATLEVASHPDDPYQWPASVRNFISSLS